jgi:hypothetical protein
MKQNLQIVHSKKKLNYQASQQPLLKTKVQPSLMTTDKKLGQQDTTTKTIALGFSLTEEAVEDNLYDTLSARYTKALARAMSYTKQVKAANVLNNGFDSGYAGGDGKALFVTDHPLTSGGTNSNTQSVAADLNETSLETL